MFQKITLIKIVEWGTYLLVFLLPWQARWIYQTATINGGFWEYGSRSLYATELILLAVVALFLLAIIKNRIKFSRSTLSFLVVAILAWSLLGAVWAIDRSLAVYHWVILVEGFLFYFLISRGPAVKIKIMISFVLSALVQSVLAWWQFLAQDAWGNKWLGMAAHSAKDLGAFVVEVGNERWLRAYGSLPHPNILGAFLVIALIFLLILSLAVDTRQKRLFVAGSWVVIIPALFFTFSRAAWGALVICYLLFVIWIIFKRIKSNFTIQLLVIGVVLAGIFAGIFWEPAMARTLGGERLEVKSNQERLALYNQDKILLKDYWYNGVGLGNYTLAVYNKVNNSWPAWDYQPVHNIYLLILTELGIVGLALYLFVIGYLLFGVKEVWVGKLALISLLFIGLFDHFWWSLYFGVMLWWFLSGLLDKQES